MLGFLNFSWEFCRDFQAINKKCYANLSESPWWGHTGDLKRHVVADMEPWRREMLGKVENLQEEQIENLWGLDDYLKQELDKMEAEMENMEEGVEKKG